MKNNFIYKYPGGKCPPRPPLPGGPPLPLIPGGPPLIPPPGPLARPPLIIPPPLGGPPLLNIRNIIECYNLFKK